MEYIFKINILGDSTNVDNIFKNLEELTKSLTPRKAKHVLAS
jgi:hypothetical protein